MSTTALPPVSGPGLTAPALPHPNILVDNRMVIPGWVRDHPTYRQWVRTDEYPESGWVSFLDGEIYVDLNMEELFTHNQVKQAFNVSVGMHLLQQPTGRFVPDRMLFSNLHASLTTEPDGLYAHWATMQSHRLRFIPGTKGGYLELEGTPDMILEIISRYSETKDTVRLRSLYEKASIPEYWLVDARKEEPHFDILRLDDGLYQSAPNDQGWLKSEVFNCFLQLVRDVDPLGQPLFFVKVKS